MGKGRLAGFTDAVMAIIMTIVVIGFAQPEHASWESLWDMRATLGAYGLSFFWLAAMWVNLHDSWQYVERISTKVVWATIVLLFFSSLIPWTTLFVADNFEAPVAQASYGIVVLLVTLSNMVYFKTIDTYDSKTQSLTHARWLKGGATLIDLSIKVLGILLTLTVWPPAVFYSVVFTLVVLIIPPQLKRRVAS